MHRNCARTTHAIPAPIDYDFHVIAQLHSRCSDTATLHQFERSDEGFGGGKLRGKNFIMKDVKVHVEAGWKPRRHFRRLHMRRDELWAKGIRSAVRYCPCRRKHPITAWPG